MQFGGVEQGQGAVLGVDQQAGFRAAKDDGLGAALAQGFNDLPIDPAMVCSCRWLPLGRECLEM